MTRGRRRGSPATREQILDAARKVFDERGFRAASLRAVARTANVDPALVHYYFDSKVQLYTQSVGIGINPERVLAEVITPGRRGLGRRLMAFLTDLWESEVAQFVVESARENPALARQYAGVIVEQWRRAADILGFPHGIVREESLAQAIAVVAGVVTSKYLLELEPATSLTREQAIRVYGDLLQGVIDAAAAAEDPEEKK